MLPLSNWTELDIWQYVKDDGVELPSLYYAHRREVFRRERHAARGRAARHGRRGRRGRGAHRPLPDGRETRSCTGAVESPAATVDDVIAEVAAARITERGATRADDRISEAGMEDRKREGYF